MCNVTLTSSQIGKIRIGSESAIEIRERKIEKRTSLPSNQSSVNFVAAEAGAERIEERRAEDSLGRGRAVEDSLAVVDIREAGIPAAGIRAVDILPFRSPPADNLRM